jgi:hypothetical protein
LAQLPPRFITLEISRAWGSEPITQMGYRSARGITWPHIQPVSMPPLALGRLNTAAKPHWSHKPAEKLLSFGQTP